MQVSLDSRVSKVNQGHPGRSLRQLVLTQWPFRDRPVLLGLQDRLDYLVCLDPLGLQAHQDNQVQKEIKETEESKARLGNPASESPALRCLPQGDWVIHLHLLAHLDPRDLLDLLATQATAYKVHQDGEDLLESQVLAHQDHEVLRESRAASFQPQKPSSLDPPVLQDHKAHEDLLGSEEHLVIQVNQVNQAYQAAKGSRVLGIRASLDLRDQPDPQGNQESWAALQVASLCLDPRALQDRQDPQVEMALGRRTWASTLLTTCRGGPSVSTWVANRDLLVLRVAPDLQVAGQWRM